MASYKNKYLGWVLAASIAFSTLLPFFALYNHTDLSLTASPSKLASLFGEKALICTGEGFTLVKWTDLLAGKAPVKQHKEFFCPLCYVSANGVAKTLPPDSVAIFLTHEKSPESAFTYSDDFILKTAALSVSGPRAPPLFLL